jgi:hypothetical protein
MTRRITLGTLVAALICLAQASAAGAATPQQLSLGQTEAFSILGRSCGGIQEQVYATGFAPSGFPTGDVYMQTRCGGSGRGGGYKSTTFSAWASVVWDWFAGMRSFAKLEGAPEVSTTFSAEDAHGDRVYNVGPSAFLQTGEPPIAPPAAPTGVQAIVSPIETGDEEEPILRFQVTWTPAGETAALITSSTVTATPIGSIAPVLTATITGVGSGALLGPLQRHTNYSIIVTNSDAEGTSEASTPIEVNSSGSEPPPPGEICEQDGGTIKLSPGLTATPHVQSITMSGQLKGCDGPAEPTEGSYVAHLSTVEAVTCSALSSVSAESSTTPLSLVVNWSPKEAGTSHGTLVVPLTEWGGSLEGTLEGGPFEAPQTIFAASLSESFTGGATCGVSQKKHKVKPVKSGTFATSALEIGA